jgi:hypothetical protein
MSSPFSTFRKQQKTWLAVLGVVCMVAFVFGSTQCNSPPSGPTANAVVASTKYGDLREGDIYEMRLQAIAVDRFLTALVGRTSQALVQEQKSLEQFQQQIFMGQYNQLQAQGMILFGDESQIDESILIDNMLLARRAQQNGVVISDRAINEFLGQVTQEKLTRDDLVMIVNEQKINQDMLFDGLRTRLAARSMRQMFLFGLANLSPAQKWEYYLRLNRRARAEFVAVPVANFVSDVKTPDDATIRSFFEEHKEQIHQPGSPEPGFKQPHQVALQYFKADYEKFMDEDAITQEEIEAHYEKFKDTRYLFTEPVEPPAEQSTQEPDEGQTDAKKPEATGSEPQDAKKSAASDNQNKAEPGKSPVKDERKDESAPAKKADENKADENKADENKAEEKKADESKSEEAKSEENKSDESQCGGQEQQKPAAQASPPSDEAASEDAAAKPDEAKSAGEQEKQPAATEKPADAEKSDAAEESKEPTLLELSGQLSLPQSIRDGPRPKYNPLWRVEKDIRRELAGQKASEKITELFRQVKPVLDNYYDTFNAWKADHPDLKGDAEHPRPPRPDFAELAEKYGLSAHETGLLSMYEVTTETDVGQALAEMGQRLNRPNYVEAVLQTPPLYKAFTVQDLPGNQYLYWKVNDVPEHVPALTDEGIRDEVVAVWKEIQARELAQKKAQQLAEQAGDGKAFSDLVADDKNLKLIETQPFTWMTAGNPFLGPTQPRLTEIPGVESPGEDFMRTVFSLEQGKTAVALNAPKTVAYAIRVTSLEPSLSVLRETFAVESPRQAQNFMALAQQDNFETTRNWLEEVREDAGLHWNRPAVTLAMRNQR